jgi:hypothetical protein
MKSNAKTAFSANLRTREESLSKYASDIAIIHIKMPENAINNARQHRFYILYVVR